MWLLKSIEDWLLKRLGGVPSKERVGISLDRSSPWWVIGTVKDFPHFVRLLPTVFSEDSILYVEGVNTQPDIEEFLAAKRVAQPTAVAMGTAWPCPRVFHLLLTRENVSMLAAAFEQRTIPEICDHLHVYKKNRVVLEAYDLLDGFVCISPEIPEGQIQALCSELGCRYIQCHCGQEELDFLKQRC